MDSEIEGKTENSEENNPKRWLCTLPKVMATFTIILSGISSTFSSEIPGSLQNALMKNFDLSASDFALFYTLYSVPSIFATLLCGYLIDKFLGLAKTTILFTILSLLGSFLFALGGNVNLFWLMAFGRFIFGSGIDACLGVCVNIYIFRWFNVGYTNFIFCLLDNGYNLGFTLVYQTSYRIYEFLGGESGTDESAKYNLGMVLIIDTSAMIIFVAANLLMTFIPEVTSNNNTRSVSSEAILSEGNASRTETTQSVKLTDCFKFPMIYWLLCIFSSIFFTINNAWSQFSQGMLLHDYRMTEDQSSELLTIMSLTKIAVSIPLSLVVDHIGRNMTFVTLALLLIVISHIIIMCHVNIYTSMVLIGTSQAIFGSTIWPMYLYLLDNIHHGLGYGISMSIYNIISVIGTTISGEIIDTYGYFWVQIYYLAALGFGLALSILTYFLDWRESSVLNMSPQQRHLFEKEKNVPGDKS